MFTLSTRRGNDYLRRYDPFRELDELQRRFFNDNTFGGFGTDIIDKGDSYCLQADLPGFKKEDIHVDVDGNRLTISAERNYEDKEEQEGYIRRERSYGSYCRTFDISEIVADEITADYTDGVLTLNLPKTQPKQPTARRIELK